LSPEAIEEAVQAAIHDHAPTVQRWLAGQPGSWGFLAAKAVIACRDRLGRPLTPAERRQVWQRLWRDLNELKSARSP
jgi:hypothetical protein